MIAAGPKFARRAGLVGVAPAQRLLHSSTPLKSKSDWLSDIKVGGRSSASGITATVFGASGFLGGRVVNNIGKIGSRVICPYRGDGMNVRHLKLMGDLGQIVSVPFDIRDPATVERAVSKSNVVVTCIGNQFQTRNFSYRQTYVDSTKAIVEACKKVGGVERIIRISAVNASMDSESPWLQANAEADEVLMSEFPDATILKVTRMFGEMDKFISSYCSLANQAPITPIINNGEQLIQPVFVNDVANAISNAVVKPESMGQTYYLGGPEILVLKEMLTELHKHLYLMNSNITPVPLKVARAMGYALENLRMIMSQAAVMTEDQVIQDQYDVVLPPNVPTLKDLDVDKLTKLSGVWLERIATIHRGERGPDAKPTGRRTWDEIHL
mmetsp:Transcript_18770/g.26166  ORF Transcript_18770/g.26166 Transcript_18770/m.26166 type:complete len:383 (-) Transcript_18770:138-1286(-)|eukprot:CAMPEP_0184486854 /NCGR_PEP_ID=MMETSP0113_2-20130426/8754_1 /TAXON_ID=91329 /ORGANISM="Norrisiella sphaerica, Strain BC52" /LENGTH=382 /DNA_ID=CAMNT_0026868921 /DNA_START=78 /DNA_END=1226 /DNA_ORIENTATION=-